MNERKTIRITSESEFHNSYW